MKKITIIGIDLAKNVFQLCGVDSQGKHILRRRLMRAQVIPFFAQLPSCLVAMEACASSQYWARTIEELGHEVKRIPAQFVTPYRRGNKTDATDAAAICEAVQRPNMRFVPNKTQEQADIQALHRVRSGFVQTKTATINQIRGLLAENGIIVPQGVSHVRKNLPTIIDDLSNALSGLMRQTLGGLYEYLVSLDMKITQLDKQLKLMSRENEDCKRLMQIPGIGVMNATILVSLCGHVSNFSKSRAFASFLGLTPNEHSSGGKQHLGGITKRGNVYARSLLVHGARAVIRLIRKGKKPFGEGALDTWLRNLLERRGVNKTCVALANKLARIVWVILTQKVPFQSNPLTT